MTLLLLVIAGFLLGGTISTWRQRSLALTVICGIGAVLCLAAAVTYR